MMGDKVVFYSANKGILKNIIPDGQEPYTNARPEEKIDATFFVGGRVAVSTPYFSIICRLCLIGVS